MLIIPIIKVSFEQTVMKYTGGCTSLWPYAVCTIYERWQKSTSNVSF